MRLQTAGESLTLMDPVERALLVATCLWGGHCYEPCPHHAATREEVESALDWLDAHSDDIRAWEERRATGLSPLGLIASGHVGQLDGPFWECETCGFRFDAVHTDHDASYSCPACEAALLRQLLDSIIEAIGRDDRPAAWAAIARERLRMWEAATAAHLAST